MGTKAKARTRRNSLMSKYFQLQASFGCSIESDTEVLCCFRSHVGWLFTNREQRRAGSWRCLAGLPHIPALFRLLGTPTWQYSVSCFRDFQTLILKEHDRKSSEKRLCVCFYSVPIERVRDAASVRFSFN